MLSIILQLLVSLTILVFIHELGHYSISRLFKVRVDKFYLFFDVAGKALLRFRPKNSRTEFGVGWLPVGGYCKIAGMVDESFDVDGLKQEPKQDEFRSRPAWQRFMMMVAGVVFNVILAVIIYAGISYHWGDWELPSDRVTSGFAFAPVARDLGFRDGDIVLSIDGKTENALSGNFIRKFIEARYVRVKRGEETLDIAIPDDMMKRVLRTGEGVLTMQYPFVVDSVMSGRSAANAGIRSGDRLLAINGKSMTDFRDAQKKIKSLAGQPVTMTMSNGGVERDVPVFIDDSGMIGVSLKKPSEIYDVNQISYTLLSSIPAGIRQGVGTIRSYVSDMKYVFTKEGVSQMGGFGTIGSLFPRHFTWLAFWSITALLSVMLAVMNILPIPGLDGGHIMFLLFEMVTGRKVSTDVLIKAQIIGMALLLTLVFYANANDVFRFLIK